MLRIILSGCNGKMGREISACAAQRQNCAIVAGIDRNREIPNEYPVFAAPEEIGEKADVVIDFSHPALLPALLQYGKQSGTPLVLCTTGYHETQVESIREAAGQIPIFYSGNMSLGVNLLMELSKKAVQILGDDFDVEIIEKHHNQKIDAPSGTALMLADAVSSAKDHTMHYVYDRHSQRKKRESSEIGIHSVRGGTIVGEHEVIFAGPHEMITLSHSAQSKEIFAHGAINAAFFLAEQRAGLYDMSDLLKQEVAR